LFESNQSGIETNFAGLIWAPSRRFESNQSGIETRQIVATTRQAHRLNRTRVELKHDYVNELAANLNQFESNQSGIETFVKFLYAVSYCSLNRTRVELKQLCARQPLRTQNCLNRTRVELKLIIPHWRAHGQAKFESNQSGIETLSQYRASCYA
jgi:hypothetical protein